jgi:predicted ATPase
MPALRQLRVTSYLSLRDVTVPLGPVNVLVGPNASGKSNLLDVVAFLRDAVRTDLRPAIDTRGGYSRVRFRGRDAGAVRIELTAQVTRYSSEQALDEYRLEFSGRQLPKSARFALTRREEFRFKRTRGRGRRLTIRGSDLQVIDEDETPVQQQPLLQTDSLALATLPRLADEAGGAQVRQIAELFATFRVFDVDVVQARQPKAVRTAVPLRDDAANLSAFLLHLSQLHGTWQALEKDLRHVIPGVEGIHFEQVSSGEDEAVVVELVEAGLRNRTRLSEASYGTIRALALLAVLYDPDPPHLTCIEEFDHGLHPYAFDVLVERLRESSERTQYLIATHSPALVNRLHASELIVCEREPGTGASRLPAIDASTVREMEAALEGELGLGELWFSGSLGGVPHP